MELSHEKDHLQRTIITLKLYKKINQQKQKQNKEKEIIKYY